MLGHGWPVGAKTQIIWGKIGARTCGARLGHGSGKVGALGMVGVRLGHGLGKKA